MDFDKSYIDNMIRKFRSHPTNDDYFTIYQWYENNLHIQDSEYIIRIYLFLLGANIKHKFTRFSYEQHMEWIKEIRTMIEESSDPVEKLQRKAYFDYGSKS